MSQNNEPTVTGILERQIAALRTEMREGFGEIHRRIDELGEKVTGHSHGNGQNGTKTGGVTVRIGTEALKAIWPTGGAAAVVLGTLKVLGVI